MSIHQKGEGRFLYKKKEALVKVKRAPILAKMGYFSCLKWGNHQGWKWKMHLLQSERGTFWSKRCNYQFWIGAFITGKKGHLYYNGIDLYLIEKMGTHHKGKGHLLTIERGIRQREWGTYQSIKWVFFYYSDWRGQIDKKIGEWSSL